MGYFPFFIDIAGKSCAVIGGGSVALRKIEKLLPFGCDITVTAPDICREIRALPVRCNHREFVPEDLEGAFLAIAATSDHALNSRIHALCSEQNILCNAVDDRENCSFLFPALAQSGDLTIGISSGGTSPVIAKYLRHEAETLLNDRMMEIAALMKAYRPVILAYYGAEKERREASDALLSLCLSGETLPDKDKILQLLEAVRTHEDPHRDTGQSACPGTDKAGTTGDTA